MKTPGKWQFFLLNAKPEEGFTRDIAGNIVRLAALTIPFVLLFLVYNIVSIISQYSWEPSEYRQLVLHWSFCLLSATSLVVITILGRNIRRHAHRIVGLCALYCALACLWATLNVYFSFDQTSNISIYSAVLISVAALSYLRPYQSLVLFLSCQTIVLLLIASTHPSSMLLIRSIVSSTTITVLSMVISYARYSSARAVYSTHRAAVTKQKEIEDINRKLRILVHTDDLTGLYNRRFLDDFLPGIWNSAIDSATPLAFLMMDIDDFKKLNDCEGHQAGDRCIAKIAQVLAEATNRSRDYVLRYGGEEFVVIMTGVSLDEAVETAEQIRSSIEQLKMPNRGSALSPYITVSVGVYHAVPTQGCSFRQFFSRSDEAMYEAKRAGKNRVVTFYKSPDHPPGQYERVQMSQPPKG